MELREVLTRCATLWLEHEAEVRPAGVKLPLTDKEIEGFIKEATSRSESDIIFSQIDDLLKSISVLYPIRVSRIQRELKWLRKQARKRGMAWGRR